MEFQNSKYLNFLIMGNKMILPFELGRSTGGMAVTQTSEIDDVSGKTQEEINTENSERLAAIEQSDKTHHSLRFGGLIKGDVTIEEVGLVEIPINAVVVWHEDMKTFLVKVGVKYYNAWLERDSYIDPDTEEPYTEKQYITGSSIYMWEEGNRVFEQVGGSGSGDGAFDVSAKYPTSGVDGGNTYTLDGALAVLNANLSANKKKGGMSIKFIQSSDNKYVQYRLMADSFSITESDWQGVDDEPTAGSENLVKSGGAYNEARKIVDSNATQDADLDISDEQGNVIIRCKDGHIKTKNFDSSKVGTVITDSEMDEVLEGELAIYLTDIDGNAVLDDNGQPIEII